MESSDRPNMQRPFLGAIDFIKKAIHNFPSILTLPLPQSEQQKFNNMDEKLLGSNISPLTCPQTSQGTSQNAMYQNTSVFHPNIQSQLQISPQNYTPPNNSSNRPSFSSKKTIRNTPFEPWEDNLIRQQQSIQGNHWKLISNLLPNRSPCSIKNRWYTVLRYLRDPNRQVNSTLSSNNERIPSHQSNHEDQNNESHALLDILKNVQNELYKRT